MVKTKLLLWLAVLTEALSLPPVPPCTPPTSFVNGVWSVQKPCLLTCANSSCSFQFDTLTVEKDGEIRFDGTKNTTLRVRLFLIDGKLRAGSETSPFRGKLDIVLTGRSEDQDNSLISKVFVVATPPHKLPYSKVLLARPGSIVELHGMPKTPWLKLRQSARAGDEFVVVCGAALGWVPGDKLLLPTTAFGPSAGVENEVVTLRHAPQIGRSGDDVWTILALTSPLRFDHDGESADARLRGEVAVLSHNIRILGNNTDAEYQACTQLLDGHDVYSSTQLLEEARRLCYGGHTAYLKGSSVRVSNAELFRLGQATRIARYPVHWHLAQDVSQPTDADESLSGSYVRNNSIWQSYQRCATIHGTWGALVEGTVCYATRGHAFYLEDSVEFGNTFANNLAVAVRKGPMVCSDHQVGPAAFWITNPNNTFVGNMAVDVGPIGYGGSGVLGHLGRGPRAGGRTRLLVHGLLDLQVRLPARRVDIQPFQGGFLG